MEKFFIGLLVLTSFSVLFVVFGFVSSGLVTTRVTREFSPLKGDEEVCSAMETELKNPSDESPKLPPGFNPDEADMVEVHSKTLREFRAAYKSDVGKTSGFLTCPGLAQVLNEPKLEQLKVFCPCKRGRLASCALAIITCIVQLALNIFVMVTVFILQKPTDVKRIWMINSILFGICLVLCAISLVLAVQFNMQDSPDDVERVFAPSSDPNVDGLVYFIWLCMDLAFCLIALIVLLLLKFLTKSKSVQDRKSTIASTPSKNSKGAGSGGSNKSRGTRSSTRSRTNKNTVAPASQSQSQENQNKSSSNSVNKNPSNRNVE